MGSVVLVEELETISPKKPQHQSDPGGDTSCYKYLVAKTDVVPSIHKTPK
jgi:hypothetical protein